MRFVEIKNEEQLDMQTLQRARDRMVGERTALINQLCAILLERGVTVPQACRTLAQHLATMLDGNNDATLSPRISILAEVLTRGRIR
jgi:transposase